MPLTEAVNIQYNINIVVKDKRSRIEVWRSW